MFKRIILISCITVVFILSISTACQKKETWLALDHVHEQQALNTQLLKVAGGSCVFDWLTWLYSKEDALKSLLDQKASIDATDANGETALCKAIYCAGKNNQPADAAIKLLINSGSSLCGSFRNGSYPLKHAFTFKMYSVVEMLVKAGAKKSAYFGTPLHSLINSNDVTDEEACRLFEIFKRYGLNDIDINAVSGTDHTAVCTGMMNGRSKPHLMDQLFLHGATPWCPAPGCKNKPLLKRFDQAALAAHEQWKGGAMQELIRRIPVRAVVEGVVMSYVFSPFKK